MAVFKKKICLLVKQTWNWHPMFHLTIEQPRQKKIDYSEIAFIDSTRQEICSFQKLSTFDSSAHIWSSRKYRDEYMRLQNRLSRQLFKTKSQKCGNGFCRISRTTDQHVDCSAQWKEQEQRQCNSISGCWGYFRNMRESNNQDSFFRALIWNKRRNDAPIFSVDGG